MGTLKHQIRAELEPNNRILRAIAIALFGVCMSTTAYSGDLFDPPMMGETPSFSWAGGYVGAVGGYNMNKDLTYETYGTSIFEYPYHLEGFSYGAKAGYNFDVNTFIVGVEGDIEKSTVTGGFYNAPDLAVLNPGGIGEDTTSWQGSIRARMGITADRFLVFGTGGYAFAQMQNKYTNPTAKISESFDRFRNGWTVGGGVDYAATDNIIIGAEYRHTEFLPITNISSVAFPGATGRQAPISDAVRLSVSFKF